MPDSRHGELDNSHRVQALKPLLRQVLELLGEDPCREGLTKTPERWAKALLDYTKGAEQDAQQHLSVIFQLDEDDYPADSDDMIIVDNITFGLLFATILTLIIVPALNMIFFDVKNAFGSRRESVEETADEVERVAVEV